MRYERPETMAQAAALLQASPEKAYVLAGGTDLLVRMHSDEFEAKLVVDIKSIEGMSDIVETADEFVIGAAVSCAALAENAALVAAFPGVVEAANLIGSTQVQSRCTMSGNLCNASPAADSVPALVAAGAKVKVTGPDGSRLIPVEDVPTGPGKTSLGAGEIVEAIMLAKPDSHTGDAYLRFIPRTEMDIAVVGVGVSVKLDDAGQVIHARVALGAVGPKVILSEKAADALVGSALEQQALEALSAAASEASTPIDDKRGTVAFRKKVAGVLAARAAKIAYDRARGDA